MEIHFPSPPTLPRSLTTPFSHFKLSASPLHAPSTPMILFHSENSRNQKRLFTHSSTISSHALASPLRLQNFLCSHQPLPQGTCSHLFSSIQGQGCVSRNPHSSLSLTNHSLQPTARILFSASYIDNPFCLTFPSSYCPVPLLSFAAITLKGAIYTCSDISNSSTSILSLTQSLQAFTSTNSITIALACQGHQ